MKCCIWHTSKYYILCISYCHSPQPKYLHQSRIFNSPNSSRTGRSWSSKVSESKIPASIQRIERHDRRVWIAGERWNTTSALRWPLRDGNLLRWQRDFARNGLTGFLKRSIQTMSTAIRADRNRDMEGNGDHVRNTPWTVSRVHGG